MDIYTHITEDTDGTLSKPLASYLNKDTISKNVYIKNSHLGIISKWAKALIQQGFNVLRNIQINSKCIEYIVIH
ncbi:hypothetical protein BLX88_12480 [Bacillus obstructivus]|nr:hypothetical protein BLX88_12480 [Bacillus obstructivus]